MIVIFLISCFLLETAIVMVVLIYVTSVFTRYFMRQIIMDTVMNIGDTHNYFKFISGSVGT